MPAAAGESVPVGPGHRETNLSHKKVPKTFNVRELFDVLPLASYFMYETHGHGVMDKALACHAAGKGSIPATSKLVCSQRSRVLYVGKKS